MTREVLYFEGAIPCESSVCQVLTVDVNQLCVREGSHVWFWKSKVVSQGQICPPCQLTWVRFIYSVSLNGSDMPTLPVYMGQICPLCLLEWVRKTHVAYKFTACILQKRVNVWYDEKKKNKHILKFESCDLQNTKLFQHLFFEVIM